MSRKIDWSDFCSRIAESQLVAISEEPESFSLKSEVSLRCRCGAVFSRDAYIVWNRRATSCGCVRRKAAAKINEPSRSWQQIFEALNRHDITFLGVCSGRPHNINRKGAWRFRCRCGSVFGEDTTLKHLISGNTRSCGCLRAAAAVSNGAKKTGRYTSAQQEASRLRYSITPQHLADALSKANARLVAPLEQCHTRTEVRAVCSCGREFCGRAIDIVRGLKASCGCLKSGIELELLETVRSMAPDAIHNDRSVISPLELDVWVPEARLGVELNGLYWHSEAARGPEARLDIVRKMKAMPDNARLITFFEDEWVTRRGAVEGYLRAILAKKKTVGARKTELIDGGKDFVEQHHIQGATNDPAISLALDGEVVASAQFRKAPRHRSVGGICYELTRYCVGPDISVIGGMSKLLENWRRRYRFDSLVTYADNRLSYGGLYSAAGFVSDRVSPPSYWYVRGQTRHHRFAFRKDELARRGLLGPGETERACMMRLGYVRIWDAGKTRWVLT